MAEKPGMSANAMLVLGLGACGGLVVIALVGSRFLKSEPPPPPPPPPPAPEASVTTLLRYTASYYKALLDDDAKRFQIPTTTPEALAQPFPYADELAQPKVLKADKDTLETTHLKISTRVAKEWATTASGQGFRFEHMILGITNKTDRTLAYRVETATTHPEKCASKGALAHNALALKPGETLARTECLWHPGATLTVKRVEVLELPDLAFFYVSRLTPAQVLLDERTAAGHEPAGKAKPCGFVPWREIKAGAEARTTGWVDVVDFYGRHNCDEYSYFRGYHRWTAPGGLPAHAASAPAAQPANVVDRTNEKH